MRLIFFFFLNSCLPTLWNLLQLWQFCYCCVFTMIYDILTSVSYFVNFLSTLSPVSLIVDISIFLLRTSLRILLWLLSISWLITYNILICSKLTWWIYTMHWILIIIWRWSWLRIMPVDALLIIVFFHMLYSVPYFLLDYMNQVYYSTNYKIQSRSRKYIKRVYDKQHKV